MAHLVARHGNATVDNFFQPNDGRLRPSTAENLEKAKEGIPCFDIPCLTAPHGHQPYIPDQHCNPLTNSIEHYALFDWFHEGNSKSDEERLRNVSLLEGVAGLVDSQAAEQCFSSFRRDLYFLNQMSPAIHIFVFRLLCHLKNTNKNKQLEKTLISDFGNDVMLSDYGQLSQSGPLTGIPSMGLPTPSSRPQAPQSPDSVEILSSSRSPDVPLANDNTSSLSHEKGPAMSVADDAPAPNPASVQSVTKSIMDGLKRTAGLLTENIQQTELPILRQIQELFLNILGAREISLPEMQTMTDNMRYAGQVLFRTASRERQQEISCRNVLGEVVQCQGTSNYCGLCCINNILGPEANGQFPVTVEEMNAAADEIWTAMALNPMLGVTVPLVPMRDREGFYSMEVMQAVLEARGITCVRIQPAVIQHLSGVEVVQNLYELGSRALQFIVRLSSSEHWVTVKCCGELFKLIDSSGPHVRFLSAEQAGEYVKAHALAPGAVYVLVPPESRAHSSLPEGTVNEPDPQETISSSPETVVGSDVGELSYSSTEVRKCIILPFA